MKKMLKIMAMVLVIATVVFAAGCSSKGPETPENGTSEPGVTEGHDGAIVDSNNTTAVGNNTTVVGNNTTVVGNNTTVVGNNTTVP